MVASRVWTRKPDRPFARGSSPSDSVSAIAHTNPDEEPECGASEHIARGRPPLFRRGPERGGLLVGRQPLELLEGVGGSAKAQLARPSIAVTSTKFVSDVVETRFP